jgi:Ser/Thr protein kinase RdoA (MazF antagonist)
MDPTDPSRLREAGEIAARFAIPNIPQGVAPLGSGLINHTFLVSAGPRRWVLQRINERVFPEPERIMENLARLCARLARRPLSGLLVPGLVYAADGAPWVRAGDGGIWRLSEYVAGGRALSAIDDMAQAAAVGRALGTFHAYLSEIAPEDLEVTLPGFHATPAYISRFTRLLQGLEYGHRAARLEKAAAFVAARSDAAAALEQARRAGRIHERVTHGDPKLDNMLFDASGRRVLAIVDLDTLQPGLLHYDIADCLRSCCNRTGESGGSSGGATFDLRVCSRLLGAYASSTRGLLLPADIDLLYDAIRIIPLELGVRFMTDHLEGDRWFRVSEHGENLSKAMVQFEMVAEIERKEARIRAIIRAHFRRE